MPVRLLSGAEVMSVALASLIYPKYGIKTYVPYINQLFPLNLNGSHIWQCGQRHCLLVAASNPFSFPRPVLLPKIQILDEGEISKARVQCHLADAETVAGLFAESCVSLSVICPKKFPRLRAIYNAGNLNHQATEFCARDAKNPQYLVLLSQNFGAAHAALNQLSDFSLPWNLTDDDMMILQNIFCEPSTTQQDIPTAFFPTTAALPNGEGKNWNDVDEVEMYQDILDEMITEQQEINSCTSTAQPEKGKTSVEDGVDIMMLREKKIEHTPSEQEISATEFVAIDVPTSAREGGSNAAMSNEPGSAFAECSNNPDNTYKRVPSVLTSSHSFTSQEHIGLDEFKVELTPAGIVLSQNVIPRDHAEENASLQSNLYPHQVMNPTSVRTGGSPASPTIRRGNKLSHQTMWSLTVNSNTVLTTPQTAQYADSGSSAALNSNISGNLKFSQPSVIHTVGCFTLNLRQTMQSRNKSISLGKDQQGGHNTRIASSVSEASNFYENIKISQRLANLQGRMISSYLSPSMIQEHFSRAQMQQDVNGKKRKHFTAFSRLSMTNESGIVIPAMEKSERFQGEIESSANSLDNKTTFSQMSRVQPEPPNGYTKEWEGYLTSKDRGQAAVVSKLVAYRKTSNSGRLATNWPLTLHMDQLISQNYLNNIPHKGHVEYLIFDAMNPCTKLNELEEKRLCMYIKLPQQTLILSFSNTKLRLIGTLYPEDFQLFKHQIYSPQ
ncbi:unnamed protein product [Ilex paraguariensis]|uniref:Mediator of RNA polymerase II transcription subunit 25 n=1 Tax=Ilex paraguariensis TaxID=185542 RepID=A0ABC8UZZ0_9AQUA